MRNPVMGAPSPITCEEESRAEKSKAGERSAFVEMLFEKSMMLLMTVFAVFALYCARKRRPS